MAEEIEPSPELIELEEKAWAERQTGMLTYKTAADVWQATTAEVKATGRPRPEVEMALKKRVRGAADRVGR